MRSLGRNIEKSAVACAPRSTPARLVERMEFSTMAGLARRPIMVGTVKSSRVTAKVAQLMSVSWVEAR